MKKSNNIHMLLLAILASTTSNAAAEQNNFVYSAGWLSTSPSQHNIVQLGEAFNCSATWCAKTLTYDGLKNISRTTLPEHHEMKMATRATRCTDGNITSIPPEEFSTQDASLVKDNQDITFNIGRYIYTWAADDAPRKPFKLIKVQDNITKEYFQQVTGYGSFSDTRPTSKIPDTQFIARYQGEISHKDMNTAAKENWIKKPSNLNLVNFRKSNSLPGLYNLMTPGNPDVSIKAGKQINVWHTFFSSNNSPIEGLFIHEYGHDFNGNGCFDDLGHNKFLLPAIVNNSVRFFFYVEYSPDIRDKVPMISVGQYTRE